MPAEVSDMAEAEARTLARVIGKPARLPVVARATEAPTQVAEGWSSVHWPECSALDPPPDFFSIAAPDVPNIN